MGSSSTPALGGHGRQWHLPSLSNQAYFLSGAHVMINRPYNMAGGLPAIPAVNLDTQLAMQQDAPNLQPPGFFGSLLAVPQRFAPNVGASPEAAGMNLQQQQLLQATLGGMPTVERDRYSAAETLSLLGSAGFMRETQREAQQHKRALAPDAASAQASSSKQKRQRGTLASTLLIKYPKSQSRVLTGQHNPITHACCMHSTVNGKRFITAEALRKAININFPDITFQEPYRIVAASARKQRGRWSTLPHGRAGCASKALGSAGAPPVAAGGAGVVAWSAAGVAWRVAAHVPLRLR